MSTDAQERTPPSHPAGLFGPQEMSPAQPPVPPGAPPRLQRPDRQQVVMRCQALDATLAEDHPARLVWAYVEAADLGPLHQTIKAVRGHAGRSPIDPRILLALWLYATLEGVGSARQIERLCESHAAYEWICGGVGVNYHTLSDFRGAHVAFLDGLLTDSVAALVHEGLVSMNRVAQDGMRVRANAGAASFRRAATLEACQAEAQEQVRRLREELGSDPGSASARQRGARERAARERSERIERALGQARELDQKRQEQAAGKASAPPGHDDEQGPGRKGEAGKGPAAARASTSDPEARVMKMADGGFRPAFNVQYATDTATQVVTGVDVSNIGSDMGQMAPMVERHQERYGQAPAQVLVDGGFTKQADIEQVSAAPVGVEVIAPAPKPRKAGRDPHQRRAGDSDAIAAWRERMGTDRAKSIYKERAATAECVNAIARNRGLRQFLVRGLEKARAVALWYALAHNLVRAATLRARAALGAPAALPSA